MSEEEKKSSEEGSEENKPQGMERVFAEKIQLEEKRLELTAQYIEEMKTDERMQEYFAQFEPSSVEKFIEYYAEKKAKLLTDTHDFAEWNQNEALQWVNQAMERLEEIQQKKLFDLQCLWRAEKEELPGVEICMDFAYWEREVMDCPFIPHITEEETELYIQYLQSSNVEHEQGWFNGWQDYQDIKEAYETGNANRNFPEWYDFYNGRKGTGVYMILPDIRGMKEKKYIDLWREEYNRKQEEKKRSQPPPEDPRPYLGMYQKGKIKWFVETFEDKKTRQYYHAYTDRDEFSDTFHHDIHIITHYLKKAGELIPVEAWFDYREALLKAWEKYECKKIAEAIPAAYSQYLMRVETGIRFSNKDNKGFKKICSEWREDIKRGRELCGEPPNLDF